MSVKPCPPDFRPGCDCSIAALKPRETCYVHGSPDQRVCPWCGQFRGYDKPCKRCGCNYFFRHAFPVPAKG